MIDSFSVVVVDALREARGLCGCFRYLGESNRSRCCSTAVAVYGSKSWTKIVTTVAEIASGGSCALCRVLIKQVITCTFARLFEGAWCPSYFVHLKDGSRYAAAGANW